MLFPDPNERPSPTSGRLNPSVKEALTVRHGGFDQKSSLERFLDALKNQHFVPTFACAASKWAPERIVMTDTIFIVD